MPQAVKEKTSVTQGRSLSPYLIHVFAHDILVKKK